MQVEGEISFWNILYENDETRDPASLLLHCLSCQAKADHIMKSASSSRWSWFACCFPAFWLTHLSLSHSHLLLMQPPLLETRLSRRTHDVWEGDAREEKRVVCSEHPS